MSAFIGSGKIKIAPFDSGASFGLRKYVDVANTSAFQFSFTENRQELRDYRDPAGGIDASVARIESVTGSMDLRHFTADNLALALWGTTAALAATPIVGEAGHVFTAGKFIPAARLINTTIAPVVKKGATTLNVADYVVSAGGITCVTGTAATAGLVDGDAITIDYTPLASTDVQALINSAPNVSVFFEGVNAVSGKAASARMYKCKLGVAANVGLIGDDFGTLAVTFTVEKDTTISGGGTSQFFAMQQAT